MMNDATLQIGSQKQMFIDERFFASAEGIDLVMNPPVQDAKAVLRADRPWEPVGLGGYNTVQRDADGRFRMWYAAACLLGLPQEGAIRLCYAESDDGVCWTKPSLGRIPFQGSTDNNIVAPPLERQSMQGATVYRDDTAPPTHRYRLWSKFRPTDEQLTQGAKPGLYAMHSPDGIDWTIDEGQPNPRQQTCDTQNMFFFDLRTNQWVGYTRVRETQHPDEAAAGAGLGRYRAVGRITSPDFKNWSPTQIVFEPDARDWSLPVPGRPDRSTPSVDVYTNCTMPYPWAQDVYLMLPGMYYHWDSAQNPALIDVQLLTSRDGITWRRMGNRAPFLRRGCDGSPSAGMIFANPWLIDMGPELWLYYAGFGRAHNESNTSADRSGIYRCRMRRDGFVSADAGYDGGSFVTPTLVFEGHQLELNVQCSAGGWLQVELLDASGRPIEGCDLASCDPVTGDAISKRVSWKGRFDLKHLRGTPLRMRIVMRDTKLYAFQFADA